MASISSAVASAPDVSEQPTISPAPTSVNVSGDLFLPAFEEVFEVLRRLAAGSCANEVPAPIPTSEHHASSVRANRPTLRIGPMLVRAPPEFRSLFRIPRNEAGFCSIQG